ncbi:unnamed protein product [Discosporangium mesarthrocarpum]
MLSPAMDVSLFGCLTDPIGLALTCCCPCVVSSFTRARIDERECTPLDALCGSSAYSNRQSLRAKYNKGFSPVPE